MMKARISLRKRSHSAPPCCVLAFLLVNSLSVLCNPVEEKNSDWIFIRKAVSLAPLASFESFPLMQQEMEEGKTVYRLQKSGEKIGPIIFQRNSVDLHKHVVILNRDETHLKYASGSGERKIYVVLIQNAGDTSMYHVLFAYVRNLAPNDVSDTSVITHNREKRRVEWDVWEERSLLRNKAALFGWTTCLESLFVPCKGSFPEGQSSIPEWSNIKKRHNKKVERERIHFLSDGGLDSKDNFAFFGDLDDDNHNAAFLGTITDLVVEVVHFFVTGLDTAMTQPQAVEAEVHKPENQEFMKSLLKGLKDVGFYSLPSDHQNKTIARLLHEGYRVMAGLFNNSYSTQNAEKLTIAVFADDKPKSQEWPRVTGRSAKRVVKKITKTSSSSSSSSSSNSMTKTMSKTRGGSGSSEEGDRKKRQGMFGGMGGMFGGMSGMGGHGQQEASAQVMTEDGQVYQGYIPGKVGGTINGEDWRVYCAKPDLDEGEKTWCSCHIGKDFSFGMSEDVGDTVGVMLSGQTVNDNPSSADDIFNTAAPSVFCGTTGKGINIVNNLAGKQLGVDKSIGVIGQAAGTVVSYTGGVGVIWLAQLAHQGLKVAGQGLGIEDILGMENAQSGMFNELTQKGTGNSAVMGRGINIPGMAKDKSPEPLAEVDTDVELFGKVGWRFADVEDLEKHVDLKAVHKFGKQVFSGFGNCDIEDVHDGDFEKAETILEVARLYHKLLRTQCNQKQALILSDMVDEGKFVVNEDKTLSVSEKCPILKKLLISDREIDRMSLAFSFAAFTQAVSDEVRNPAGKARNPLGHKNSRSTRVMLNFALNSMCNARRMAPGHFIKLARDLVHTLKFAFSKTLQDYFIVRKCTKCSEVVVEENKNDCLIHLGLIQFIIEGLGPVEVLGRPLRETWEAFYKLNFDKLNAKLDLYLHHVSLTRRKRILSPSD